MGSSSSNASSSTSIDRRVVTSSGIGVSGDSNVISVQSVDPTIAQAAFDTVKTNDALMSGNLNTIVNAGSDGFDKLVSTAEKLFTQGQNLIGQTQSAVADAYSKAQNDAKSTIDNRTIVVLGVAAAGVAAAYALRKK
jgi:hypothetical protein